MGLKHNKLSRLIEPGRRLDFLALLFFAAVTIFFNPYLAVAEAAIAILLYLYSYRTGLARRREILKYIDSVSANVDVATKDTMVNAPLPMVIFRPDTEEVIWSNERFLTIIGEGEHLFDTKLSAAVPGFHTRWLMEGKSECPGEVVVDDGRYLVFGNLIRTEEAGHQSFLATTYWVNVTDYSAIKEEFFHSRPVLAILLMDSYDEFLKGHSEQVRSSLLSEINARVADWVAPTHGLLCRYDRDRYLFIFEERYLPALQEGKYAVLDAVHDITNPAGLPATLSIGIGKDADTMEVLQQYANLALDMALSRGGDQAVIKNKFTFEFYGGRSKEPEKRTKVKSRVMANAMAELVSSASRVFVMGHKFPDLDCVGAAAGIVAACRKRGVPAHIIRATGTHPGAAMNATLAELAEYKEVYLSAQDALILADVDSLLVVVDTNRPEQVLSEELLASCNKVAVVDHHRRAATYIANAALNFHEPYASSASELVTELLQYILEPNDLLRVEAEALLSGIVLDTKQFTMRTGGRTFDAAAFLRRSGADTAEVKKLFQNDLDGTIARYDIIQNARMYKRNIAVARVDHSVGRVTAAQAADELLNISGIDASFVLFPEGDLIILSARSLGDVNVQVVLEKLGGGGNAATAGAQVPGTLEEVSRALIRAIDQYLEDD